MLPGQAQALPLAEMGASYSVIRGLKLLIGAKTVDSRVVALMLSLLNRRNRKLKWCLVI